MGGYILGCSQCFTSCLRHSAWIGPDQLCHPSSIIHHPIFDTSWSVVVCWINLFCKSLFHTNYVSLQTLQIILGNFGSLSSIFYAMCCSRHFLFAYFANFSLTSTTGIPDIRPNAVTSSHVFYSRGLVTAMRLAPVSLLSDCFLREASCTARRCAHTVAGRV